MFEPVLFDISLPLSLYAFSWKSKTYQSLREILDSIPFYRENKLVQAALKRVEQYIEEKHLNIEKTSPKEEKGEIQKNKSQKRREDMSL